MSGNDPNVWGRVRVRANMDVPVPGSFQERQRELCLLSSYILEQEQWLESILKKLEWCTEALGAKSDGSQLAECPINKHHFVPEASLEKHKLKCQLAAMGIDITKYDEASAGSVSFYRKSAIPRVEISPAVGKAIVELANTRANQGISSTPVLGSGQWGLIDQSEVIVESHDSLVTREHFASLEDDKPSPQEIRNQPPMQFIRYVKSWRLVPRDLTVVSSIRPEEVKAWLFTHLPREHAFSSSYGGEVQAVESIMQELATRGGGEGGGITPDSLMTSLKPLLGLKTRPFLLDFWKFLHISVIQQGHGITDSDVEELTPLPMGERAPQREGEAGGLAAVIEAMAQKQETGSLSEQIPLPMEYAVYNLSTEERRIMYDYIVEVGGEAKGGKEDHRDDMPDTKEGLSAQDKGEKSYLETLKEQRDYKRRRQTYRAKNVHITRRTPKEVMRDIINSRMEEIKATFQQQADSPPLEDPASSPFRDASPSRDLRGRERASSHRRSSYRHRSPSSERSRRHSSTDEKTRTRSGVNRSRQGSPKWRSERSPEGDRRRSERSPEGARRRSERSPEGAKRRSERSHEGVKRRHERSPGGARRRHERWSRSRESRSPDNHKDSKQESTIQHQKHKRSHSRKHKRRSRSHSRSREGKTHGSRTHSRSRSRSRDRH